MSSRDARSTTAERSISPARLMNAAELERCLWDYPLEFEKCKSRCGITCNSTPRLILLGSLHEWKFQAKAGMRRLLVQFQEATAPK
jgi:hypothetical protein